MRRSGLTDPSYPHFPIALCSSVAAHQSRLDRYGRANETPAKRPFRHTRSRRDSRVQCRAIKAFNCFRHVNGGKFITSSADARTETQTRNILRTAQNIRAERAKPIDQTSECILFIASASSACVPSDSQIMNGRSLYSSISFASPS